MDLLHMLNGGVNEGSVVVVNEMKGTADNKAGVDMLLTSGIAPLIQGNTEHRRPNNGRDGKRKKKIPFEQGLRQRNTNKM